MSAQNKNNKSKSQSKLKTNQKEDKSQQSLKAYRERLRKEAQSAIKQVKDFSYLTVEEIMEAEELFNTVEEANQFLRNKNEEIKKNKGQKNPTSIPKNKFLNKKKQGKKPNKATNKLDNTLQQEENKITKKNQELNKKQQLQQKKFPNKINSHSIKEDKKQSKNKNQQENKNLTQQLGQRKMMDMSQGGIQKVIQNKNNQKQEKKKKLSKRMRMKLGNLAQVYQEPGRKWNQQIQNQKHGKFQPEQKQMLIKSLTLCALENNIEIDKLFQNIGNEEQTLIPSNLKFWTVVCSVLPNRSLKSSYKFLIRKLRKNKNAMRKWTIQQEEQLLDLHQKYGNRWKQISQRLGRAPQAVRDKFRNLQKRPKGESTLIWPIQELVTFFKLIQQYTKVKFLKQGIQNLLSNREFNNQKQKQSKQDYKYNSKFMLSHNTIKIMDYIDADLFGKIGKGCIKWKQISQKIGTKRQSDCKNKYIQFLEILNRDYDGEKQGKVLEFIQNNIQGKYFIEDSIQWDKWDAQKMGFTIRQAECKWAMLKKKLSKIYGKGFKQIFIQAKALNEKKINKFKYRLERLQKKQKNLKQIIIKRRKRRINSQMKKRNQKIDNQNVVIDVQNQQNLNENDHQEANDKKLNKSIIPQLPKNLQLQDNKDKQNVAKKHKKISKQHNKKLTKNKEIKQFNLAFLYQK